MNAKLSLVAALSVVALGGAAVAADLPRRATAPAPYVAPVPVFTWTGFYAGVNAGYGWGKQKSTADATFGSLDGAKLGGTVGYNQQVGALVFGVEGDWDWSNAKNTNGAAVSKLTSEMTARGRVGYAVDRVLLFTTGGYAGGTIDRSVAGPAANDWHNGYVLGGGMEYAFTSNVSAKAEYLYTDLSSKTDAAALPSRAGVTENTVRMGVNYRF
jgi:outer membrane immunogenic protein